jgi:hypothetical protein
VVFFRELLSRFTPILLASILSHRTFDSSEADSANKAGNVKVLTS